MMLRQADETMEQENVRVKALLFRAKVLEITGWQEGNGASLTLHQKNQPLVRTDRARVHQYSYTHTRHRSSAPTTHVAVRVCG